MTDQYIPSLDELKGAKLVEDSLMRLLVMARKKGGGSELSKEKTQAVFGSYQKLKRKLRESAGRSPERQEQFDLLLLPKLKPRVPLAQTQKVDIEAPVQKESVQNEAIPTLLSEKSPTFFINNLGPINRPGLIYESAEVGLLQVLLGYLGFAIKHTTQFDSPTLKALKSYQMKAKLPITGQVDLKTRKNLNIRLKKAAEKLKKTDQLPDGTPIYEGLQLAFKTRVENQPPLQTEDAPLIFAPADYPNAISEGDQVRFIQEALKLKSYDVDLTGIYDKKTFAAVRSVQAKNRLKVTGTLLPEHLSIFEAVIQEHQDKLALIKELHALRASFSQKYDYHWSDLKDLVFGLLFDNYLNTQIQGSEKEKATLPPLDDRVYLTLELGTKGQQGIVSEGIEVVRLQEALVLLNHDLKITETFDLQTFSVLKSFQSERGFPATGIADLATRSALFPVLEKRYDHEAFIYEIQSLLLGALTIKPEDALAKSQILTQQLMDFIQADPEEPHGFQSIGLPETLQSDMGMLGQAKVSQGLEVLRLQQGLQKQGFDITMNAQYDEQTKATVRSFQTQKKLPLTGKVDAKTRAALNLLFTEQVS